MLSWEISLGNLLTCISIIFAGSSFYWKQLYDSKSFKIDITEIKAELKVLGKIITDIALQNQRLDNQGERINRIDQHIDEIRRGEGFIRNA